MDISTIERLEANTRMLAGFIARHERIYDALSDEEIDRITTALLYAKTALDEEQGGEMTYKVLVSDELQRQRVVNDIRRAPLADKPFVVQIMRVADIRSLDQNSLIYTWYGEIAKATHQSIPEARRECKLVHGVPILRAADPAFREAYDAVIKPLPYELKLKAMDIFPVTSLMSTKQCKEYLDTLQRVYAEQGIRLEAVA